MKWTSEQVAGFVNQLPGCDTQGKVFHQEVYNRIVLSHIMQKTGLKIFGIVIYTAEPIYSYMIGKNAGPNQVLINKNDHLYNSPRKPGSYHNDPGS